MLGRSGVWEWCGVVFFGESAVAERREKKVCTHNGTHSKSSSVFVVQESVVVGCENRGGGGFFGICGEGDGVGWGV